MPSVTVCCFEEYQTAKRKGEEEKTVAYLNEKFKEYYGAQLNEYGKEAIRQWIKEYNVDEVMRAWEIAFDDCMEESAAFMQMERILIVQRNIKNKFFKK